MGCWGRHVVRARGSATVAAGSGRTCQGASWLSGVNGRRVVIIGVCYRLVGSVSDGGGVAAGLHS